MKGILKNFAKLFSILLMAMFLVVLVSCGETPTPKPDDKTNPDDKTQPTEDDKPKEHVWTENELFWDSDKNGTPDWQEKEITLRYATWQYDNPEATTIDTLLIEEFMERYPNIHVEMQIVGGIDEQWETNFLALLETPEDIPDVFLINRLERILNYNLLADLTDFFDHDEDTEYIFESVKDLGLYKGRRYCIPTYLYPEIWVVNKTLLEECNIEAPGYDWTWDQMEAIAKAVHDASGTAKTIGLYGEDEYYFELPKILKQAVDPEVGSKWAGYSYDGTTFNFDDDAVIRAIGKMETALQEGWLMNLIDLTKEEGQALMMEMFGSTNDPRYSGNVAIWRQPSWQFKDYMSNLQFEWDIYPGPSGVAGGNTDIAGVSQLCENKAAAYQLLKWLSYSKEGLVTRYELYEEYGTELYVSANNYPYPIVDYGINGEGVNEIWDNIPYTQSAPGYGAPQFVEALRNGAIKTNKEVIGWDAAENTFKDYMADIVMGNNQYASLYQTIQENAIAAMQQKRDAVDGINGN